MCEERSRRCLTSTHFYLFLINLCMFLETDLLILLLKNDNDAYTFFLNLIYNDLWSTVQVPNLNSRP